MNERTSTRSGGSGARVALRVAAGIVLAAGLTLLSPALAGAQTDDTVPDDSTTTSVPDIGASTTTIAGEATTTTTSTTVPAVEEPTAENITVVQTPDEDQSGPCQGTPALALGNYVHSDETTYRLRIVVKEPLCDPIEVVAAIYAMPGNGEAWPQNLVETLPFTLQEKGTTDVTFTKTCDPVQFDVITGETPPVIAPLGEWHGPLLFPFDVNTSLQHWGCPAPTTAPPEVLGTTSVPPAVAPAQLALTGSSSNGTVVAGGALLLLGAGMLIAARRRSSDGAA